MNAKTLETGVTHPTIHIDYYHWRGNLTQGEHEYLEKFSEIPGSRISALLMFAWSRSRETLKQKVIGESPRLQLGENTVDSREFPRYDFRMNATERPPVVWNAINEPFAVIDRPNQGSRLAIRFYETDSKQLRQLELSTKDVERLVQFIRRHPDTFADLTTEAAR